MARYIDADKLVYDLEIVPLTDDGGVDANDLDDIIERQPTADVVEVVRCKDCKFWAKADGSCNCINNNLTWHTELHYCSYGERKIDARNGNP